MVGNNGEVHTLEIKNRFEQLNYEVEIIKELKLMETSVAYSNHRYDLKMFDPDKKTFYSVEAYDLVNKSIILLVSKLQESHENMYAIENKFEDYFIEVDFEEYKTTYLPLLENDIALAKSFIQEIC